MVEKKRGKKSGGEGERKKRGRDQMAGVVRVKGEDGSRITSGGETTEGSEVVIQLLTRQVLKPQNVLRINTAVEMNEKTTH